MKRFLAAKPHTALGQSFGAGCGKWEWMDNAQYVQLGMRSALSSNAETLIYV
jgi:hypothetical protein